jgi:hypothetical protein
MNPCQKCGRETHLILVTSEELFPCCWSCLEKEKRKRKRSFGDPGDGTLFTDEKR